MADIVEFSQYMQEHDLNDLTREELLEYLDMVWAQVSRLDEREPEDMASEEYEAWGEYHEELEDLVDAIQECLEELGDHHG